MPKIAILGAGYAANFYVKALPELGYSVVGITDLAKEKGLKVAEDNKIEFFDSYEDLLKKSGADMIFITTPTPNHLEAILKAVDSGIKWIYCEKPIAYDTSEAKKIQEVCKANGVILGIGYKMRFESIFRQIKSILTNNELGKLSYMSLNFFQTIPHSRWFLDSGFVRETISHIIDLSNWFAGANPVSVYCESKNVVGGLKEDRASVIIEYDSGITASINGGWIPDYAYVPGRQNVCFQIVGEKGYVFGIRPDKLMICTEEGRKEIAVEAADPIKLEVLNFIDNAIIGKTPPINIIDGIMAQAVVDAALESADKKSMVSVNI